MLNIRLAIATFFIFAQISILALGFREQGLSNLLGNFAVFLAVVSATIIGALVIPHRQQLRWLHLSFFSSAAFLVLILILQYFESIPTPALTLLCGQLATIVSLCVLVCWVQNCLSEFENSIFGLGLHDPITALSTPLSEERIQSMLMNSRYTGQPIGLIAIDSPTDAQRHIQTKMIEKIQLKLATAHWQNLISQNLQEELRLIDKFYKDEKDDRLILVCPGMSCDELSDYCQQLSKTITEKLDAESTCSYVSFPEDSLTLDGLITRLREQSSKDSESETTNRIQTLVSLTECNVTSNAEKKDTLMPSGRATVIGKILE